MRSIPAQIKSYAPGFALALVIALLAKGIEALLPFDVIGASVIAMFIGMLINGYRKPGKTTAPGVKFTAKKILKFAIILLGASLNVTTILNVGRMSLTVMLFTLLTCFGGGYFIGRALGLDWKLSNLISAGTGICGGSAIAAVAPVIDAKDSDIAYALSATFLFDMAMIVLFPIMGRAMGLSDMAYGLWTGNVFQGQVLSNGKPVAGAEVEVEYMSHEPNLKKNGLSAKSSVKYPNGVMVTQAIMTDANGVFTFGIPKAGWWGFAALGVGPDKKHDGKELSQDAVIWVQAVDMK